MNRRNLLLAGAAGLILAAGAAGAKSKWVNLYNGQDLAGWHVKDGKPDVWQANGEMLSCKGDGGGWLTSNREYGDFQFQLDWRIPKGGNSGVGLRFPAVGDPAHEGMEIQILDDDAPEYKGKLQAAQYTGGIYYQVPAKAHPAKPAGEWNHYDITCKGSSVKIKLNGVEIQDADMDAETKGEGGHKPLSERPKKGFVGLQSHGVQVDFRNLRIREL